AVQLYALRSGESWGVGGFADLCRFGRWSRRAGASLILLNPLGAQTPTHPYQPSPYYASTRRFRNVVYLRVEEVQGAEGIDLSAEREAAQRLNAERIIDYDRVFELKSKALEKIFRVAPEPDGLASFARRQGCASARRRMSSSATDRTGACHRSTRGSSARRNGCRSSKRSAPPGATPRASASTT